MDRFDKICKDIKEVKIQGARAVAKAAINALLLKHDNRSINKLVSLRPTEPALRNAIKFVMQHADIKQGVKLALDHFDYAEKKIAELGSRLIEDEMLVFTYCHSSSVANALIEAKKQGKKFVVHNTETRPLFQGRITAKQLANAKIPVKHFIDSAARVAFKKADIMLIGCDAITTTKIYNKIGSEMFAIVAEKYGIPIYVYTDAWKFDSQSLYGVPEEIEKRNAKEIWRNPPKGVKIENPAFEKIDPDLVSGIVSELGVLRHDQFIREVEKTYRFMFEKEKI
jgi:ribose 1,5-bisphosphate isomerase